MQNSKLKINLFQRLSQEVIQDLEREKIISPEGSNNESGKILTILGLAKKYPKILWITAETDEVIRLANQIKGVANVRFYQNVNQEDEKDYLKLIERQKILYDINFSKNQIIISDVAALFQEILKKEKLLKNKIKIDQKISLNKLASKLSEVGYNREERVVIEGDFASRGDILDIFSPQFEKPVRLEFFGNKVSSIYFFDPASGDKIKDLKRISILSIKSKKRKAKILDYLSSDFLIVFDQPDKIANSLQSLNIIDPKIPKIKELQIKLASYRNIYFQPLLGFGLTKKGKEIDYYSPPNYKGNIRNFLNDAKSLEKDGYKIFVSSDSHLRIKEIFERKKLDFTFLDFRLEKGLISKKQKIVIYTDSNIFGISRKKLKLTPTQKQLDFLRKLTPGQLIVHIDHGIGRFLKIKKYTFFKDQKPALYVFIEFDGGDRLYLPASQSEKISKYIGISGINTKLSKLGSPGWAKIKKRISQSTYKIARELLELSALRKIRRGFKFLPKREWEDILETTFPYQETLDQKKAIETVYGDMKKNMPMDRLICGDVGFGKTEIAIRAAARAVANQKQVALICPTTILSEQHLATFKRRLSKLPIKIESLSRFKSRAEQKEIIENLKKGSIDVIVGTHRLLQKDILFSDLGLLVIDEEQRFGVRHKERFKKLRAEVDILTLTATPIPRTLYAALGGLKKISKIQTPPMGRLPIETKITKFDKKKIKEIIINEKNRQGQVYFIHNWVRTIYSRAQKLSEILPKNIKIGIAHGQMATKKLARVMADFTSGKYDLLLATTIVENGLDLSNVNTLIVDSADRFGLSELYQLRGRVGRGDKKAYAYFLVKGKGLTDDARKRLSVLLESKDLGSGFMIATRDLELRGGGNILGKEQSGHIAEVGLNLYSQLLKQSVEKIRSR